MDYCTLGGYGPNRCGLKWYRIEAPDGKRWIDNPFYLEQIEEKPVQLLLLLTGTEDSFSVPYYYITKKDKQEIPPQLLKAVGMWEKGKDAKTGEIIAWYKVETAGGDRWIMPRYPVLTNVQPTDDTIHLTETSYLSPFPFAERPIPADYRQTMFAPQQVRAFEIWTDPEGTVWYHIHAWKGDQWVRLTADTP